MYPLFTLLFHVSYILLFWVLKTLIWKNSTARNKESIFILHLCKSLHIHWFVRVLVALSFNHDRHWRNFLLIISLFTMSSICVVKSSECSIELSLFLKILLLFMSSSHGPVKINFQCLYVALKIWRFSMYCLVKKLFPLSFHCFEILPFPITSECFIYFDVKLISYPVFLSSTTACIIRLSINYILIAHVKQSLMYIWILTIVDII